MDRNAKRLVRFDGIRFTPWVAPSGEELPAPKIGSLRAARDGGLWIGTTRGLALWNKQKMSRFGDGGRINAILEDRDGTVWVACSRVAVLKAEALCRVRGADLECYDKRDGTPIDRAEGALALGGDPSGRIWVGSMGGIFHWQRNRQAHIFHRHSKRTTETEPLRPLKWKPTDPFTSS